MSRVRYGTCLELEEAADALLKESLDGVFSHQEKSDILTPWKDKSRHSREVYVSGSGDEDDRLLGITAGVPEKHVRQGMFHRAQNIARPDLNSRDGLASGTRHKTGRIPAYDAGLTSIPGGAYGTITLEEYQAGVGSNPHQGRHPKIHASWVPKKTNGD